MFRFGFGLPLVWFVAVVFIECDFDVFLSVGVSIISDWLYVREGIHTRAYTSTATRFDVN